MCVNDVTVIVTKTITKLIATSAMPAKPITTKPVPTKPEATKPEATKPVIKALSRTEPAPVIGGFAAPNARSRPAVPCRLPLRERCVNEDFPRP